MWCLNSVKREGRLEALLGGKIFEFICTFSIFVRISVVQRVRRRS
jgi:hypothetical protein